MCLLLGLLICCVGLSIAYRVLGSRYVDELMESLFTADERKEMLGLYSGFTSTLGLVWSPLEKKAEATLAKLTGPSKKTPVKTEDIDSAAKALVAKCETEIQKGERSSLVNLRGFSFGEKAKTGASVVAGGTAAAGASVAVVSTLTTSALGATLASWGIIAGPTIAVGAGTMALVTIGAPIAACAAGFYSCKWMLKKLTGDEDDLVEEDKVRLLDGCVKVAIYMAWADGSVHEAESRQIRSFVAGLPISEQRKAEYVSFVNKGISLEAACAGLEGNEGAEGALLLAWQIALADGDVTDSETKAHDRIANALGLGPGKAREIRSILADFVEEARRLGLQVERPALHTEAIKKMLIQGGLVDILSRNTGGGDPTKCWLWYDDNEGKVQFTTDADIAADLGQKGCQALGPQSVPGLCLQDGKVFRPKRDEASAFLQRIGLGREDAEEVIYAVGLVP